VLVKPPGADRPEFHLAPLLLQEVRPPDPVPPTPYSVYFWRTAAVLTNRALEQFNYLWFRADGTSGSQRAQGIRITFDPAGKPIVWEVLRDASHARILFVSQSLEAAAMMNNPAPLAGRRFWIERSLADAPDTVVARIIDDGPTPLGPILYLAADSQQIVTLICRCMDAQAGEVLGEGLYGIATLDDAAVRWLVRDKTPGITRWLPGKPPDDLGRWLRIKNP